MKNTKKVTKVYQIRRIWDDGRREQQEESGVDLIDFEDYNKAKQAYIDATDSYETDNEHAKSVEFWECNKYEVNGEVEYNDYEPIDSHHY